MYSQDKERGMPIMTMYVITCYGFQGSQYYATREAAQEAAEFRSRATGKPWIVKAVRVG